MQFTSGVSKMQCNAAEMYLSIPISGQREGIKKKNPSICEVLVVCAAWCKFCRAAALGNRQQIAWTFVSVLSFGVPLVCTRLFWWCRSVLETSFH